MNTPKTPRTLRIKITNGSTPPNKARLTATQPRNAQRPPPEPLVVFELLELILLHLPMRDLLLAQRVCKRWSSVICTSPPIQRALYLLPQSIPNPTSERSPAALRALFIPNPLLAEALQDCMQIAGIMLDSKVRMVPRRAMIGGGHTVGITLHSSASGKGWENRFRHKDASWRKMLVTQPPVMMVVVDDRRIAPDYDDYFCENVMNHEGARMGDVLDLEQVDALPA